MREIPIADFLSAMGIRPTKQKGNALWYSAPYRTERTPSFKVDTVKNVWFDFGTGKGGDIFDLAGEFIGSGDFLLRAAFIAKSGACPLPALKQPQRSEKKEPVFEDIWVRPLQDAKLLGYLKERGIDAHIAIPNCEEVLYRVHGKRYYAIGFRNDAGGLELRKPEFGLSNPPFSIYNVEIKFGLFGQKMISGYSCNKIDTKSIKTSVPCVFYLHDVLKLIIYSFHQRSFA